MYLYELLFTYKSHENNKIGYVGADVVMMTWYAVSSGSLPH